jgi:hypothetical protein
MTGHKTFTVCAWVIAGAALLHYAFYQIGYAINSDNALMIEYAKRWLAGGIYGVDVFDPNPPASFLIYIPAVFLSKFMPVWHALTFYTSAAVMASSLAVWVLLKNCNIGEGGRQVVTIAYVLGNLVLTNIFYGERDHLIFLALMPLCLLQFGMLNGHHVSGWLKYPVLLAGAIAIAVKPHYALMPAIMILGRVWRRRALGGIWEADTKIFLSIAVLYSALLAMIFPEYIYDVLPVASLVYVPDIDATRLAVNVMVMFVAALAWLLYATGTASQGPRQFTNFLMVFSVSLTLAALAQLKGYYYHAIPQFILIFVTVVYLLYQLCLSLQKTMPYAVAGAVIGCVLISYLFMPPAKSYLTHDSFKATNINRIFEGCEKPCSAFIFDEYPDIAVMASIYNSSVFASRFPSYWFLPEIFAAEGAAREKFQAMVADDIERYKPDVLAIVRTEIEAPDRTTSPFDFIEFFSMNSDFKRQIQKYEKTGILVIDRADYHRGTTLGVKNKETFDLYRLKKID